MPTQRPFQRTAGADASARKPYDIITEPAGEDYRDLLTSALALCDTGVLVFPKGEMTARSAVLMERLRDNVVGEVALPMGTLVRFRFNEAVIGVLTHTVDSLYEWRGPQLPEDLCLFRRDGTPWLVTVSRERLGYVELTPFEKLLLARKSESLPGALVHQGARDAVLAVFERRLEASLEELSTQLADYATALADDGRDGLVEALAQWLDSGEASRVSVALDVVAALNLDELTAEVTALSKSAASGSVPPVFRTSSVLSRRWSEMHRRRIDHVLDILNKNVAS